MSIHAVARQAGVSITTVSRVFNRPERVAAATRERVMSAARLLDFVPNASARTLRTHESRILGVVLPTLLNPVFAECLAGIADAADAAGYAIVPLVTEYDVKREATAIDRLLARDVDGLVVTVANASRSPSLRRLQQARIAYVLAYNRHPRHACVSVDGEAAFAEVVGWLVSLGHRRIAMASGTLAASDRARQRYRGFQAGLARAGLASGELIEMPFVQTAMEQVRDRLARPDRPTALLCSNDLLAVRCIRAARLAGLAVPGALSVVGMDGITIGADLTPRLSTIAQPNRQIGETCVATLVKSLRAGTTPRPGDSSSLPYLLCEGESCGGLLPLESARHASRAAAIRRRPSQQSNPSRRRTSR
jgi:LacI family transcriptional regulator, repressor for deo operon, udp, cdd, tsx, nupC, and nupG